LNAVLNNFFHRGYDSFSTSQLNSSKIHIVLHYASTFLPMAMLNHRFFHFVWVSLVEVF